MYRCMHNRQLNRGFKTTFISPVSCLSRLFRSATDCFSATGGWTASAFWRLKNSTCYCSHLACVNVWHLDLGNTFNNTQRVCHSSYNGKLVTSSFICSLCRGSSSSGGGLLILASPRLGADSFHSDALLGEVSRQRSIVDLLHVLLDFSFGVFQQVSLTLRKKTWGNGARIMSGG